MVQRAQASSTAAPRLVLPNYGKPLAGWKGKHGGIFTGDFTKNPSDGMRDQHRALTCISVLAICGHQRFRAHLNFGDVKIKEFVAAFSEAVGDKVRQTQVFLVGGNWSPGILAAAGNGSQDPSAQHESARFYLMLRQALGAAGFRIAGEDVGGMHVGRQATVNAYGVTVDYGGGKKEYLAGYPPPPRDYSQRELAQLDAELAEANKVPLVDDGQDF